MPHRTQEDVDRDIYLKHQICLQRHGWEADYEELIVDRYGGQIKAGAKGVWLDPIGSHIDDVFGRMYDRLGGGRGWLPLWHWDPNHPDAGAYFRRIARTICLDLVRTENRVHPPTMGELDGPAPGCDNLSLMLGDVIEAWQPQTAGLVAFRDALQGCIQKLDNEEQVVLWLTVVEGLKGPEAATELRVTHQRVRDLKKRALGKLRLCLGDGWDIPAEGGYKDE